MNNNLLQAAYGAVHTVMVDNRQVHLLSPTIADIYARLAERHGGDVIIGIINPGSVLSIVNPVFDRTVYFLTSDEGTYFGGIVIKNEIALIKRQWPGDTWSKLSLAHVAEYGLAGAPPYRADVLTTTWTGTAMNWRIIIPTSVHLQEATKHIVVFFFDANNRSQPITYETDGTGNVTIYSTQNISGYLIVTDLRKGVSGEGGGIEEAPNDGNVYARGVLSWIRGVAGSVYDAFSLQVITDIQSILTSIDLINAEILAIKNDIDNVNTTVEQLNTSLSNVITSVNQLSISVDSIIVSLGALDGRVDILESVAQGILNHIALLVNEIDLLKTAVNNFTNHVSNTQIHVPTPQGQVNGRMLETLNNALVYVDKPAGGGGLLGIINALSRDSANRIRQIRIDFGENKFKETRCAYHTTGTAIGQINFQEIKDDITNVWIRLQFSYTGAVLVAPTIRTNITNWSIII